MEGGEPTKRFADLAGRIGLLVLDSDGVLTDGGVYVADGPDGRPYGLRRFHIQDGLGLVMLRRAGIRLAIVSGRDSPALRFRAGELGIDEIHQVSPYRKVAVVGEILERAGLGWEEAACLGDDLAELALMERVALPAAVVNAAPEVKERAVWRGTVPGGEGAVREFAEALLGARGVWDEMVESYLEACREGRPSP